MSNSDERKRPFLYIDQPYIEVNEVNNQEVYISRGKRQKMMEEIPEMKQEVEQVKPKKTNSYSIPPLSASNDISQQETKRMDIEQRDNNDSQKGTEIKKVKPQFSRKRPFRELSILEKIAYIENYPSQLPPVYCFYKLPNRTVQGKLEGLSETTLELVQQNGSTQMIEIDEIIDIMLPGLG